MEIGKLNPVRGLRQRRPGKKGRSEEERQAQLFNLPVLREMQIKVRMRCYHQSAKLYKLRLQMIPSADDTQESMALTLGWEVPVGTIPWESGLAPSDKVKNVQAPRAAIPLLNIFPRENLARVNQERSTRRFIGALLITAKIWKQS